MTYENHNEEQRIANENMSYGIVSTSWHCGPEPRREIRYVLVRPTWWNNFAVGWVAGFLFFVLMDWIMP